MKKNVPQSNREWKLRDSGKCQLLINGDYQKRLDTYSEEYAQGNERSCEACGIDLEHDVKVDRFSYEKDKFGETGCS